MRFTVLGSGTSSGVPTIGCDCPVCRSDDPRDKRLRPSLLVESDNTSVIIDTSSDFRQQALKFHITKLDAVVYTHHHFDHIAGFDDIRAFNFHSGKRIPIYLMEETYRHVRQVFSYAFSDEAPTGTNVPRAEKRLIDREAFTIGDIDFIPIPLLHGTMRVNGYRIGAFAYCTDTNCIPEESFALLEGVEVLILDALRYHAHATHFTVEEACRVAERIGARATYFTHIAHNILHAAPQYDLPAGVHFSYDGLQVTL